MSDINICIGITILIAIWLIDNFYNKPRDPPGSPVTP